MDQGMLAEVIALRDKAFATFKSLDDAVVSLGGKSRMTSTIVMATGNASGHGSAIAHSLTNRRIDRLPSQSGAAEIILRERGEPMMGTDIMTALPSKGIMIGGKNRQMNFTSAMSKSGQFRSVRKGGNYYWWFKNEPLPTDWQEAPDLLSKEGSDASVVDNQEGGEANATAT